MKDETIKSAGPLQKDTPFKLEAAIERVSRFLPAQGPLKDFVHHNTLHAFQHLDFHQALEVASKLYGARSYLNLQTYQEAFQAGRITQSALERSLMSQRLSAEDRERLRRQLFFKDSNQALPLSFSQCGLRARWKKHLDLDALTHPTLFKIVSNYLDQGIAVWRMPHATEKFWTSLSRLLEESSFPLPPLDDSFCAALLKRSPSEAALLCLKQLVGEPSYYEQYLLEMLLAHPGWSGMVHRVEQNPASLQEKRQITLLEFSALQLLLEWAWVKRVLGPSFKPLGGSFPLSPFIGEELTQKTEARTILEIWQEALEWTLYEDILSALEVHLPEPPKKPVIAQVFTCLDERSCSLRRHLEEVNPHVQTFGTAGFFGMDFLYQGPFARFPISSCPVGITPKHLVREEPLQSSPAKKQLPGLFHLSSSSNTLFRGWWITQTLGLWHSLRLAFKVFLPSSRMARDRIFSGVESNTRLHLLRESNERTQEGYWLGYSLTEMADRVEEVLRSTGCTKDFSPLIIITGHGSSSANNPHFAAYDCGACGGKPGAPNARAFAWMANHHKVRALLKERGLTIPGESYFMAALHDTCRDEVKFFESETMPERLVQIFEEFKCALSETLCRNAKERCRRFEMVSLSVSPQRSLKKVRERSASIFEPRPELNHATNAICIVGRRELSRGLFLDRRAFLNSYDPEQDPSGEILARALEAVIPVCGGINLEYFFSRVDNTVYGAGTKLPHNVVSLIGVANGIDGDLRTGLPSQMVEVHDPVRLLLILEQTPEVALKAIRKKNVSEWVENRWIRIACLDPKQRKTYIYESGEFTPFVGDRGALPSKPNSLAIVQGQRDNLRVHQVGRKEL